MGDATTLSKATEWLMRDAATLHASAIDLQFARHGFGIIIGSITPVCIATRALLAAKPGSRPPPAVVAHLKEHATMDGWRYFNRHGDIPPDTDDLALVLHVLRAAGISPDEPWVAAPLNVLARNRISSGMFPTWLVTSAENRSTVDNAWASRGNAVHPEVVANIGHALLTIQQARWQEDITAAAHWLAQDPVARLSGNHWYYGSGYAAWLICNFLDAANAAGVLDGSNGLGGYRQQLLRGQNDNGAWHLDRPPEARRILGREMTTTVSNSVSETAWRVAALRCTGLAADVPEIMAATAFIADAQQADGGFAAEPFYETLSPTPYGSRTMTTSAVVHALASAG
jgi:hypothetical protein